MEFNPGSSPLPQSGNSPIQKNIISEETQPTNYENTLYPSDENSSEDTFSILAVGDIMAHADNLKSAYDGETDTYTFKENYIYVKSIIDAADFSIANFETVTAGPQSGYTSFPRFNTPDSILDAVEYAGFDVLVTANNHSLDRGRSGITATLEQINKRDLLSTGTYSEPGLNYLTTEVNGIDISILAYTQHLNGNLPLLSENEYFMVNQMNLLKVTEDIKKAEAHSDLVIVYLHWGNEYTRDVEVWQRDYAIVLFEAGADIILGTHPHVIRPAEILVVNNENKYVIYSMGNFISNFIREDNRENAIYTEDGAMVLLDFGISSESGVELKKVTHIPTWPYKYIDENGIHYEIIPIRNPDRIYIENEYAAEQARASYSRTMESLTDFVID